MFVQGKVDISVNTQEMSDMLDKIEALLYTADPRTPEVDMRNGHDDADGPGAPVDLVRLVWPCFRGCGGCGGVQVCVLFAALASCLLGGLVPRDLEADGRDGGQLVRRQPVRVSC